MTADTEPRSDETPVIEREPNDCRRCTGNGIEPGTVWPCAACYGTGKESIHPRGRVVSVSGTERGHDTRPGEIEAVADVLAWEFGISERPSRRIIEAAQKAIAALDAFRAGVPDVSR